MTVLSVFVPTLIQKVLDTIFLSEGNSNGYLIQGVSMIALMFFCKELLNSLRIRFNNKLEQKVILKLREDLHRKLLKLPISFYDQRKVVIFLLGLLKMFKMLKELFWMEPNKG